MKPKTYVIAEAGVNHNGCEKRALEMITAAKTAGADAVKFQLFNADSLVTMQAELAAYQKQNALDASQYAMLKKLELSQTSFQRLQSHAFEEDIDFIVTPFDLDSLDFIDRVLQLPIIKIGSGDLTNGPLLLATARTQKQIILSTGMANLGEIEEALKVIAFGLINKNEYPTKEHLNRAYMSEQALHERVILLHCTSEYPAPINEVNLCAMDTLRSAFGLSVGFSDHTMGIEIPLAAVAKNAAVIEKHFTLDKTLKGPDHKASIDTAELQQMCDGIRKIERALGDGRKYPTFSEMQNRALVRRAVVAREKITQGEVFTTINLTVKRPYAGKSPMDYWELIGKMASKTYEKDEAIL